MPYQPSKSIQNNFSLTYLLQLVLSDNKLKSIDFGIEKLTNIVVLKVRIHSSSKHRIACWKYAGGTSRKYGNIDQIGSIRFREKLPSKCSSVHRKFHETFFTVAELHESQSLASSGTSALHK